MHVNLQYIFGKKQTHTSALCVSVAESVSSKGHKPGGKVLEVTLYTPPVDELEDGQPQCTVEVRGVDPAKIDLYEMYFSNPRKGGDNIADLSMNEDQTVMYITFETPEGENVIK